MKIHALASTATLLVAATLLGSCGDDIPARLWLNVPRDGFLSLEEREPPPF